MNIKFSIREICNAIKGRTINCDENIVISADKIVIDSRKAAAGTLFIAIKGDTLDGHDFVESAFDNGAAAAIVSAEYCKCKGINNFCKCRAFIVVEDTKQSMLDIAKLCKSKVEHLSIIGVTGSVGKTTTKEFIYAVISQKYTAQKNSGNFNNEIGLPLTMFSLDDKSQILVQEMGMNNLGEIDKLSRAAEPDAAVITNIGTSHLEMLGTRENICRAKLEILNGMDANSNIILNADEPLLYSEKGKTGKKEVFFGIENGEADVAAKNIEISYGENITRFEIVLKGKKNKNSSLKVSVPTVGRHNVYNALAAFAAGKIYGLSDEEIQKGFNNFESGKMRQNIYAFRDITIIDDCYNASLESAEASLEVLRGVSDESNGHSIAVLSDVLEAGDYSEDIHFKIGVAAVKSQTDIVYICGDKSKMIAEGIKSCESNGQCEYYYFEDRDELTEKLCSEAKKGDTILFKASRGMKLEEIMDKFKETYV